MWPQFTSEVGKFIIFLCKLSLGCSLPKVIEITSFFYKMKGGGAFSETHISINCNHDKQSWPWLFVDVVVMDSRLDSLSTIVVSGYAHQPKWLMCIILADVHILEQFKTVDIIASSNCVSK